MDFRWTQWNVEHVGKHGIAPREAELVVSTAKSPFPLYRGDEKWLVWGRGLGGRLVQVVFLLDEDATVFIIHARPLTEKEAWAFRRQQR